MGQYLKLLAYFIGSTFPVVKSFLAERYPAGNEALTGIIFSPTDGLTKKDDDE